MAVVVRCFNVNSCTNSGNFSGHASPSDQFSGVSHFHGKVACLPIKAPKFISIIRDASNNPFKMKRVFLGSQSIHLEMDRIKAFMLEKACDLCQLPDYIICENAVVQLMVVLRLPALALVLTNALMLTAPVAALAETCEADKSFFNMPLLLFVALIGATVGGLLARQRRGELERLNEQLRQINTALRRQARIESYAPGLSYAPVGGRILENEVIVDPRKQELISHLKNGKTYLRNQDPEKAFSEFKTALELAQNLKDPIEEKKAARGLGASLQRQGKYREAIMFHSMVLAISEREGEDSGNTEACGAIADCYTELGDLERAAKYYDLYISRLQKD